MDGWMPRTALAKPSGQRFGDECLDPRRGLMFDHPREQNMRTQCLVVRPLRRTNEKHPLITSELEPLRRLGRTIRIARVRTLAP